MNNALTLGIHRVPYGIKLHIEANSEHGEYDIHRKKFKLIYLRNKLFCFFLRLIHFLNDILTKYIEIDLLERTDQVCAIP